jgi:hypothetical protein
MRGSASAPAPVQGLASARRCCSPGAQRTASRQHGRRAPLRLPGWQRCMHARPSRQACWAGRSACCAASAERSRGRAASLALGQDAQLAETRVQTAAAGVARATARAAVERLYLVSGPSAQSKCGRACRCDRGCGQRSVQRLAPHPCAAAARQSTPTQTRFLKSSIAFSASPTRPKGKAVELIMLRDACFSI